jgi:tetratricopeptide (TPR) repeat protein
VLCALGQCSSAQLPSDDCLNEAGRDPDKAIRYCTTAIDSGRLTNYELVHSLNSRGWAYYRKADFDRAIQDYNQAIQLQPDYAFAFNDRGLAYAGNRDFNRAIEDYSQAIKLNPDFALAFNNRGFAYASKRDNDRAIQDFNAAIRLRPDNSEVFYNRGRAYADDAKFAQAIQDFTQAIHRKPDYVAAFKERSEAYMYEHDDKNALLDISRAIELQPSDANAISTRGSMYHQARDYDRAIRDFSKAIQLEPEKAFTRWWRAAVYYDKGDYDAAIRDYNEVIKSQPEFNVVNAGLIYQRGLAYLYAGDYADAARDFSELANLRLSYGFYHRGLALFFMGQLREAKEDFVRGGEGPSSDLWMYLAEAKLGENAKENLAEKAPRIREQLKYWPGPIIRFYLGSQTSAQVLSAARADDLADKNPCCDDPAPVSATVHYHFSEGAAYFYLAEDQSLRGHLEKAKALFQKALLMAARNTEEYHGSVVELNRMKAAPLRHLPPK